MLFPLDKPAPDFQALDQVIRGESAPKRVHFVEELVDPEIINYITQNMMDEDFPMLDETWASIGSNTHLQKKLEHFERTGEFRILDGEPDYIRLKRDINFYYRMAFDYVPDLYPWGILSILALYDIRKENEQKSSSRQSCDTAESTFSRGMRNWQEEKSGVIASWEDYEKIRWDKVDLDNLGLEEYFTFVEKNLPEGMKIPIVGCLFDPGVVGNFFGFEDFCFFLYEKPDLIKAVIDRFGRLNYDLYERALSKDCVGFMWHADDLAFNTQTLISEEHLKEYILPWFKKYADLAHSHGKTVWLHSCGNMYGFMPELIHDIGIDAKQSFEDKIMPVTEFKERYGKDVAPLGGVDMDKLCRLPGTELRTYCRKILDRCMEGGKYAFGSGNTIANYIHLNNYFAMMEEGYTYM